MKLVFAFGLLLGALNLAASAAPVRPRPAKAKPTVAAHAGPRRPASRGEAKEQARSGHKRKTAVRRVTVRRMVHGRWVTVSRVVRVRSGPIVPAHPDTDRLREIQKALADKGYFKGEANGTWNADSVAALKQFQTDRKLSPDGKINALSLIGLGLGPKHDGSVAAVPNSKELESTPQ